MEQTFGFMLSVLGLGLAACVLVLGLESQVLGLGLCLVAYVLGLGLAICVLDSITVTGVLFCDPKTSFSQNRLRPHLKKSNPVQP